METFHIDLTKKEFLNGDSFNYGNGKYKFVGSMNSEHVLSGCIYSRGVYVCSVYNEDFYTFIFGVCVRAKLSFNEDGAK